MKILSIIAQKPYATGSGVYFTELVRQFDDMGYEQAIVCGIAGEEDFLPYEQKFPKVKMFPVRFNSQKLSFDILGMSDVMPYPSTRYRDLDKEQVQCFEKAFVQKIREVVDQFEPDLILCHHLYLLTSIVVENFADHRIAAICHGTCLRQLATNPLEKERILSALRKIPWIFALQNVQKEEICSFGILGERIKVLGNGYDPSVFFEEDNAEKDKESALAGIEGCCLEKPDPSEIRLAYAGKISFSKGLMSLLGAIDRIVNKKICLYLAGGAGVADEFEKIRERAERCRHKVVFLGLQTQPELAKLYRCCDLFVFPSYYEGLGLAIIEAMACGLPVVVSETEGLQEWVRSKLDDPPVEFVPLPSMQSIDRPIDSELPLYEQRLAEAIERQIERDLQGRKIDMSAFSWERVAEGILAHCRMGNF
ncbi:MAG: glycosyltransferase family 4 protein [Peptostreptococcaceae bacterium]|nr:glycosyltransferase family 4 protein [Peptostreptococcaceae bacterium]